MKITRDIVDNGKKIIHINYTKKEKDKLRDEYDKKFAKIVEENLKKLKAKEEAEKEITSE